MKINLMSFVILFFCISLFSCRTSADKKEENQVVEKNLSMEKEVIKQNSELDKYKKEIELITKKINEINNNISNYSVKEFEVKANEKSYKVKNFYNENKNLIKSEFVSDTNTWTLYNKELSKMDIKVIYGKYTAQAVVREFYSIGSMLEGNETFPLILDENQQQIMGQESLKYETLYDNIFISTTAPSK